MRKKISLLVIATIALLVLPFTVNAKERDILGTKYTSTDLKATLAEENISEEFKNYSENDDQITIYMFRGKGCGYCQRFLKFINSITNEYGKYFKLEAYEVWYDSNNNKLMKGVSTYLNQAAQGVPYIVIGKEVFPGYASDYDEGIKNAITKLYNTKKSERYDVIEEYIKAGGVTITEPDTTGNDTTGNDTTDSTAKDSSSNKNTSQASLVIWNLIFILISTVAIIAFNSIKFRELKDSIENIKK